MTSTVIKKNTLTSIALASLKQGCEPIIKWDVSVSDLLADAVLSSDANVHTLDLSTNVSCSIQIGSEESHFHKRLSLSVQIIGQSTFLSKFQDMHEWDWNENNDSLEEIEYTVFDAIQSKFPLLLTPNNIQLSSEQVNEITSYMEKELGFKLFSKDDQHDYSKLRGAMDFSKLEVEQFLNADEWFDAFALTPDRFMEDGQPSVHALTHFTQTYHFSTLQLTVNGYYGVTVKPSAIEMVDAQLEGSFSAKFVDGEILEDINPALGKSLLEFISHNHRIALNKYEKELICSRFKLALIEHLSCTSAELFPTLYGTGE